MNRYLLAIDQGTTSTRAILFTPDGKIAAQAQVQMKASFPQLGWVEQDPEEIWQAVLLTCQQVLQRIHYPQQVVAVGITNQRETTLLWDRSTGAVLHPAISWQDRRTANHCAALKLQYGESWFQQRTGLLLDPYFSASKLAWLLAQIPHAQARAARGELAFGTLDSFLVWRLTQGRRHITDATNASRTLLFNLQSQNWDDELLAAFAIPRTVLPEIVDNVADFGVIDKQHFGVELPITGMAGDQHAALVGQACLHAGMAKITYGTGAFLLLNTGETPIFSQHRLLTTVAYRLYNKPCFALEGSIFIAGAVVQWLRDQLHLFTDAAQTEQLAASIDDNAGVYFVPSFTGLGAPHWDPHARGAIVGLTRDTDIAHITRAALEAVAYQSRDLLDAMQQDGAYSKEIRVDGGMVANAWFTQFLSNMLALPVNKPQHVETTALGAAYLAGLGVGVYTTLADISVQWKSTATLTPQLTEEQIGRLYAGWQTAINRVK